MAILSPGKSSSSSSTAAVVLLVAVVVVGTCASGAQAQNSFNISKLCNKTIVITTAAGVSTLPLGGSLQVNVSSNAFFVPPVTLTTGTSPATVTILIPPIAINAITLLNKLGLLLQKIEITCMGANCVKLLVTFKPPLFPPATFILGPFCG